MKTFKELHDETLNEKLTEEDNAIKRLIMRAVRWKDESEEKLHEAAEWFNKLENMSRSELLKAAREKGFSRE